MLRLQKCFSLLEIVFQSGQASTKLLFDYFLHIQRTVEAAISLSTHTFFFLKVCFICNEISLATLISF